MQQLPKGAAKWSFTEGQAALQGSAQCSSCPEVPPPRLSMGRGPGARQVPTCPGGRRRSQRCAAGSQRSRKSPRVSLPLVSAWEGRRGLMEWGTAARQPGHKAVAQGQRTGDRPSCAVTCCARSSTCALSWCSMGEGDGKADPGLQNLLCQSSDPLRTAF